jgi:hypothetical protein
MPLDVLRLRDSELAALATGDEFKAAVMLWCVAWHQVPAASLPNDDRLLAKYSGAGSTWKKVRDEALRGFVLCSDGRLYHRTISEKAMESWTHKERQRDRTASATKARADYRRATESAAHDSRNDQRDVSRDEQRNVDRDVHQGNIREGNIRESKGIVGGKPPTTPKRFALPEWVPAAAWGEWEETRRKRRKPLTDAARAINLRKLEALRADGHDPEAVIKQSVGRGWDGFFKVHDEGIAMKINGKHAALEDRNRKAVREFAMAVQAAEQANAIN